MSGKKDASSVMINTILGKGSNVQGDFAAEGSTRVDGVVNGNIKITGTLIVGAEGKINGNIEAMSAIIGGEVVGNVNVSDKIEMTATARVLGDIVTKFIVIDEHAVFQGGCDMNQDASSKRNNKAAVNKAIRAGKKTAKAAIEEALKEVEEAEKREAILEKTENNTEVKAEEIE